MTTRINEKMLVNRAHIVSLAHRLRISAVNGAWKECSWSRGSGNHSAKRPMCDGVNEITVFDNWNVMKETCYPLFLCQIW